MSLLPIIDTHCDLLSYLTTVPGADPANTGDIGCAIPYLRAGNVKLQVLAVYSTVEQGSAAGARRQCERFRQLADETGGVLAPVTSLAELDRIWASDRIGVVAAIESASGLCEEDEPLARAFDRLEDYLAITGRLVYISLTHHGENRFGGGNQAQAGLKDDGKALIDHLDGRGIAVDLSHTSDALAAGILEHTARGGLRVPVIASHSNFRAVYDHARNLPDEFVQEIVHRGGLIGLNLLREYIDREHPETLAEHVRYAFGAAGAGDAICFGADYFFTQRHRDPNRPPFYHVGHEHAGRYGEILESLKGSLGADELRALAHGNVRRWLDRVWSD